MKKIIMISMIAIAAIGMIGCGEEEGTTLKWTNSSPVNLAEISWGSGTGTPDQTWGNYTSGTGINNVPIGNTTESKGIEVLTGQGDAVDEDGGVSIVELDAGENVVAVNVGGNPSNAQIKENADARLIISNAKKK